MIAAIIQARMGSTRYPEKVLKKVNGMTLLEYQVIRIKKSSLIDKIIIATTTHKRDDVIEDLCIEKDFLCYRGSENDVLGRYYDCALKFKLKIVVRLTADCPLLDSKIIDDTVKLYLNNDVDYAANTVPPENSKFPDGSDVEVFDFNALKRAHIECKDKHDREHVTFYFWKYANSFKTAQLGFDQDYSKYRITVDYPEDFEVIKFLINEISKRKIEGNIKEIISLLESNPNIKSKNSKYFFGLGWKK